MAGTNRIDNYPGVEPGVTGFDLTEIMRKQAEQFGVEIITDDIREVSLEGEEKKLIGLNDSYSAKAVIIATGSAPRKLGVPGEIDYTGKGVGYCATCDAPFFEGFDIYVVGGGNSAVEEAIYLTRFGRSVKIIHHRDALSADKISQDEAISNPKIEILWNTKVLEFKGSGLLREMVLENTQTHEITTIKADPEQGTFGVFVFIGNNPQTEFLGDALSLERGYIPTDEDMRTKIPGVFAAGDVRVKTLRQIITAAADGAIAAHSAGKYLDEISF